MRAVRRNNATGAFSWIGSDGWSARNLVSDGNEPEVRPNKATKFTLMSISIFVHINPALSSCPRSCWGAVAVTFDRRSEGKSC